MAGRWGSSILDSGQVRVLATEHEGSAVAWSHDGRRLAAGELDGGVEIWDAGRQVRLSRDEIHGGCVDSLRFTKGDSELASTAGTSVRGRTGAHLEWPKLFYARRNARTGAITERMAAKEIMMASLSPDGEALATTSERGLEVWDVHTGARRVVSRYPEWLAPTPLDFSASGDRIAAHCGSRGFCSFDVSGAADPLAPPHVFLGAPFVQSRDRRVSADGFVGLEIDSDGKLRGFNGATGAMVVRDLPGSCPSVTGRVSSRSPFEEPLVSSPTPPDARIGFDEVSSDGTHVRVRWCGESHDSALPELALREPPLPGWDCQGGALLWQCYERSGKRRLYLQSYEPSSAVLAHVDTDEHEFDLLGDRAEDLRPLVACWIGVSAYPLALCEDELRVPGLLFGRVASGAAP